MAARKLKSVTPQPEQPSQVLRELKAQQQEEDDEHRRPSSIEMEAAVREIAEAVCDYIEGSALTMPRADAGQIVTPFPRGIADPRGFGTDYNLMNNAKMSWYAAIDPRFRLLIKRREERLKILESIETDDEHVQFAIHEMHDFINSLMFCCEELGCYLGVFIGAKLKGASEQELIRIGKSLTRALAD